MKKILISIFVLSLSFWSVFWDYYTDSINSFISSPSVYELNSIEDDNIRYCEEVFLRAYMRREFTDAENSKCSDLFEEKIEAQMNYMWYVMGERDIY